MRVTVRLFARLRELAGQESWTVDMPDGATAGDVWRRVGDTHPALTPFRSAISVAINADFARMTSPVRDNDEVAFLPPVSGG